MCSISRRSARSPRARDAFAAIADPTRRDILDLLRERGPLMAGEIAGAFPSVSRPGISRHLRVLRECGVVVSLRDGKTRTYAVQARPLANLRDGWLARFADMHMDSLKALRRRIEDSH